MARLSPEEGFEILKDRIGKAVSGFFPIVGKKHTLTVSNVKVNDNLDMHDLRSQKAAKIGGRTWAVPVEAKVALVDNSTGKKVDEQHMRLMSLPKITPRYSHIVDGQEYQIDNQWRLKAGVYSRVKENGELESQFNLAKGRGFHVNFDPESRKFHMAYGTSNIPLYPILREMGVPHEEIQQHWGKEITTANQKEGKGEEQAVLKFFKASTGRKPATADEAREHLYKTFQATQLRPDTTQITLGKPFDKVTGPALFSTATKLLHISQGKAQPDPRDALMFKELHSAEDFFAERLQKGTQDITRRIQNTLDKKRTVRSVVGPDIFNRPIRLMYRTTLANIPEQTNPLEMLSGQVKTTITGEGGIKSAHAITEDAKLVDPSHLGYLDPLHTPEGQTTGVTLRLPLGVKKSGHDVAVRMFNLKTKKMEAVTPAMAMNAHVVLPDQVRWNGTTPVPISPTVKISGPGNEIMEAPFKQAHYVMKDPLQMFSMATNLVPFVAADHANRSTMAGRQMEQAIPLIHREIPLVQSRAKAQTFDQIMGGFAGHASPTTGTVERVKKDSVIIKDRRGKRHEVQLYDHFPLNADKGFLHSTPLVKAGDKVSQGQPVADTNFTRNGHLAMGVNLRLGYLPYKGYNFEDGVVISDTAAKKLTSEHLYRKALEIDKTHVLDKNKFQTYHPERLSKDQLDKLDEGGVIKPGMVVLPGDTLIAALQHSTETTESKQLARLHKSLIRPFKDASVMWEHDHPGVVAEVVKRGRQTSVHVKTLEPAEIGDKITGRHGNKGIITKIIPDHEMPHTGDGNPIEVAFNPMGVPGRTNLGQVLETAASKIAIKTGKPYTVKNFEPGTDLHAQVTKDLKTHGLSDKEQLFDPQTKQPMGEALVGPQYVFKLKHQVEKKMVARAGGPGYAYDRNMVPKGGGPHGAQSLGALGFYAMLAHGAKANLREMQTLKSDASQNDEFWAAIQAGEPLPAPRPTFAYKKFINYLNVLGVNAKKEGNNLQLVPFTDRQILAMSNGELHDAGRMVRAKDLKPEVGGLFDPKVTGGLDGNKWAHIKLPEAFPNPVFERAIQSLTGVNTKEFEDVVSGKAAIDPKTGKVVEPHKGLSGGPAFEHMLKSIDVQKELKAAEQLLQKPTLTGNRLDQVHKKVKYLRALDSAGLRPHEAYMTTVVPVLPPSMRPLSQLPNGDLNTDDLNHMYKGIALSAQQLSKLSPLLPHAEKAPARYEVYDGLRSLSGLGGHLNQTFRGVLDIIGGKRPDPYSPSPTKPGQAKTGFFQSKLVQRKQDLSMRSTIIPEPALGLDEVGLPRQAAMELYKPFVVAEVRKLTGLSPLDAQKMIREGGELANKALERVVMDRPVLLKRDPVLHKYNVQAFKPRIIGGKAVQIHPLVTSGYNADFDGDTMAAFVPAGPAAVEETKKMFPSRNLFSPASGSLMYVPTHEARLGLYGLTQDGKTTKHTFKNFEEVKREVDKGVLGLTDRVSVAGLSTTPGKLMLAHALPEPMRKPFLSRAEPLDKKAQEALLTQVAKDHRNDYGDVVNKLKDLGNLWVTQNAFSIGLADIKPEKALRDVVLSKADKKVAQIHAGPGTKDEKDRKAIAVYDAATQEITKALAKLPENHSNLLRMNRAGVKPEMDTLRQVKVAPMLISNAKGETIPTPVKRSYAEGLDVADYWTSVSGARKGIIQKVQSVQEPGYITKQVMNSAMNNLIVSKDCGTDKGIALGVEEKDVLDRHLAVAVKAGKTNFPAGTLVTPEVRNTLRNAKIGRVVVRSPLRCNHGPGVCQACFGLTEDGKHPDMGTNVGVIAGQSIGERATQLAMKAFHTGGTAATKTAIVDEFKRVEQLLRFPKTLPGSATLSTVSGTVEKVEKDPAGGHNVYIGGVRHYVPQALGVPRFGKGGQVKKGDPISDGPINPHELLPLTNIEHVQGYLANALHDMYGPLGIRRKNSEVVVKALTNLTRIEDPGDHGGFIRGDFAPTSQVAQLNRTVLKGKKPIIHTPVLKGVNVLPNEMQEDWLARLNHERLNQTIVEAAQQGWVSALHGEHPIPAVVHGSEIGRNPLKPWAY